MVSRSLSENREPRQLLHALLYLLRPCSRTAEKPLWPDSTIKFVKYTQYSPHLIGESDSKWLPLATASILSPRYGFYSRTGSWVHL